MEDVSIRINLDGGSAEAGMARLVEGTERVSAAAKSAGIDVKDLEGSLRSLANGAAAAREQFAASVVNVERLSDELEKLNQSDADEDALKKKLLELTAATKESADAGDRAVQSNVRYRNALGAVGRDTVQLEQDQLDLVNAYERMKKASEELQQIEAGMRQELQAIEEQLGKTSQKAQETASRTAGLGGKSKTASKDVDGLAKNLRKVPGPLGEAASGMKLLTKETLVFLATPIGMVLAAISAGLALVNSWFHRTEEGEEALNVMTAAFTGSLNTLLDVADDVGEWLYKAFTKPGEALEDLWTKLTNKLLADMKRVGEMGAGIVKIFQGDVGEGMAQVVTAWQGIGLGGLQQRARENGKKQAEIGRRQNALDREQREWIVEREKTEARIAELRAKIFDSSVKEAEKTKAVSEAKKLTNALYEKEQGMAQKLYEIIRDTNRLSHSSIADKTKEQEALAKTIRLEGQRNNALRMLNRTETSLGNKGASAARKAEREASEAAKRAAALAAQQMAQDDALQELRQKAEDARRDARIAAIRNDAERERAERAAQHERTLRDIAAQEAEVYRAIYAQRKQAYEAQNKDKKYENTDLGRQGWQGVKGSQLTQDEEEQLALQAELRQAAAVKENAENARRLEEQARQERQHLLDYLQAYGSTQEQKAALAKEYDEKIAQEDDTIQRAALERQKQQALKELDFKAWQQGIDWEGVFNDLERQTTQALGELKAKLRATLTAGGVTAENAKVLAEKIREIEDTLAARRDPFAAWLPGLRERVRLTNQVKEAEDELAAAQSRQLTLQMKVFAAQKEMQQAVKDATGQEIGLGDIDLRLTTDDFIQKLGLDPASAAAKAVAEQFEMLRAQTIDLGKAQEELTQAQQSAARRQKALDTFSKGGSIGQYFKDVTAGLDFQGYANLINQNVQSMAETVDKIGLGESGFGQAVKDFADGCNGFNSAIQSLASGDVFGAVNGIIDGFQGFGHMLGIGGGNGEKVRQTTERLTEANEALKVSIDGLKDEISKNGGGKSVKSAREALEAQRKYIENQRDILNTQQHYHHSHHSNAYNWHLDTETQGQVNTLLAEYAKANGKTTSVVGSDWASFSRLSPEEMAYLRTHNAQLWQTLTDIGEYDKSEFFDAFADLAGSEQEILDQLNESLTQTTFDSMKSSFISDLMDMKKSKDDFADDFSKSMMEAMLNARISDLMDDDLQKFYEKWGELSKDASGTVYELTEAELDELSHMWDGIVNQGLAIRDQVAAITGYGTSKQADQSASGVSLEKATYEQFDTFLGIATAQQIALEQGNEVRQSILDNLATMSSLTAARNTDVSELRLLAMTRNEYLLDLKKSNRDILEAVTEKMDDVIELLDEIR